MLKKDNSLSISMRDSWRERSEDLLVVQNLIQILFTDTSKTHKCCHVATKV